MGGRFDNFPDDSMVHGLFAHKINVLAAAIVVNVVKSMWIGKASFVHSKHLGFVIHIADELKVVETNTLVILCQINTSNF